MSPVDWNRRLARVGRLDAVAWKLPLSRPESEVVQPSTRRSVRRLACGRRGLKLESIYVPGFDWCSLDESAGSFSRDGLLIGAG